jgi:hypothetical protein
MTGLGNEAQARIIAEQVAEATIVKFTQLHPQPAPKPEIPAPLKWAGAIIAAIMAAAAVGMAMWIVTTLSDLQQTVTRIDERQKLNGDSTSQRLDAIEQRVTRLEGFHQQRVGQ